MKEKCIVLHSWGVVVKVGQHGGHLYTTTLFKSERGYYIMNHNAHGKDLTQNIMYSKVIR